MKAQYTYGLDLINQKREGQLSYYQYDGLGSTRALTDASGAVTDQYSYEAFGELLNSNGSTENNYLYAGEQRDSSLDQYYLRARYYDQSIGRFTQQDTWQGQQEEPATLHKYGYAGNDPVMRIDPSGNMFTLGGQMKVLEVLAVQSTISVGRMGTFAFGAAANDAAFVSVAASGNYIGRAIMATGAFAIGALIKHEVDQCRESNGKKCRIPNLVVIGSDFPEAQEHIKDAQQGSGSNDVPISPLVSYKSGGRAPGRWYMKYPPCGGNITGNSGKSCDEYPFATTYEGGQQRFEAGRVSLRLISEGDNSGAGRLYGRAVRNAPDGEKFLIVPYGPASFYIRNGQFGM